MFFEQLGDLDAAMAMRHPVKVDRENASVDALNESLDIETGLFQHDHGEVYGLDAESVSFEIFTKAAKPIGYISKIGRMEPDR